MCSLEHWRLISINPEELQKLLDELEASRRSRRRAWENLQELRWILKDTARMDLPAPVRKTIDLEGRLVKDGVRKGNHGPENRLDRSCSCCPAMSEIGRIKTAHATRFAPTPFWLVCFSDTIKGPLRRLFFVVVMPDGTIIEPRVVKRLSAKAEFERSQSGTMGSSGPPRKKQPATGPLCNPDDRLRPVYSRPTVHSELVVGLDVRQICWTWSAPWIGYSAENIVQWQRLPVGQPAIGH
jgi:hypothetical protein